MKTSLFKIFSPALRPLSGSGQKKTVNPDSQQVASLESLLIYWKDFFSTLPTPFIPLDFKTFDVQWNFRTRSRAGLCRPAENLIELNPHLLKQYNDLEEVLVHELCHLVVSRRWPYAESHGQKWKNLMIYCGMKPNRCHNLTPTRRHTHRRWSFSCGCQIHQVTTVISNRIKKGARYKCKKCGRFLMRGA